MSDPIFCLMGPTASGKTSLACELVAHFPFEIISVDSAIIYRDMNIGTAKPTPDILARIPHHLVDILDPPESYSAALFCEAVAQLIKHMRSRGKIPLLVGGTMMYFRALQQGLSALPESDPLIREALLKEAEVHGWQHMHEKLREVDEKSASKIHPHDTQRIQRALEVFRITARPLSEFYEVNKDSSSFRYINLLLMPSIRATLHERITLRFDEMLKEGLIDEVQGLLQKWQLTLDHPSMRTVGYRQVLPYLQGMDDYKTMHDKAVAATRQLAKRQLTWLRHWPDGFHFMIENPAVLSEIMAIIQQILDNPSY